MTKIEKAIILEKIHRFIFDNIYVQTHRISEGDQMILKVYDELFTSLPKFRKILYNYDNKKYTRYK